MDEFGKYNFILKLYDGLWKALIPFLGINSRLREGLDDRLIKKNPPQADIWIQAASAGEAYLACSLVERLLSQKKFSILVTTNTRQGFDIISGEIAATAENNRTATTRISYFPFDSPSLMERAVKAVSPKLMVLIETELWPGLLFALKKAESKVVIINGRMSDKTLKRYLVFPGFWKIVAPDRILAISEKDAKRFAALFGDKNVTTMPNMKFDRLTTTNTGQNGSRLKPILGDNASLLVLGSVRQEEEEAVANIIRDVLSKKPDTVTGLFPRHMHRLEHWSKTLDGMGIAWRYRSNLENGPVPSGTVILWDRFGELSHAYTLAKAVFVGGSLAPLGGQNFLEPLICGVRPVIGPWWDNFKWAGNELMEQGLVLRVDNWQQVSAELIRQLDNPAPRDAIQKAVTDYLEKRKGGTGQACSVITNLLEETA